MTFPDDAPRGTKGPDRAVSTEGTPTQEAPMVRTRTIAALAVAATLVGLVGTAPADAHPQRRTAAAPAPVPEATPVLRADYRFNANLLSSVAGAPALANVGPGTNLFVTENVDGNSRLVLRFPQGNGVELRTARTVIPADRYTMAIKLRLDDTSGYRRLVNFVLPPATADRGLYDLAGDLTLAPVAFGSGSPIDPDEWVLVVLTRAAGGRIRAYVDGTLELDATSPAEAKVGPADILRFFRDNADRQESSGAVARIRLWDRTMTPAQVAALGT